MASRILSCPSAKQFVGKKNWKGWPGFDFPGFVDNFVITNPVGPVGTWTNGGNFNVGDLATAQWPSLNTTGAGGPVYPTYYIVFKCIAARSGSTAYPGTDTTHFVSWDYTTGGGQPATSASAWPRDMGSRELWTDVTKAYLELTITTEFDNGPSLPSSLSADTWTDFPSPGTTAIAMEHVDNGTITEDWTFANNYDPTPATYTLTGSPDTYQSAVMFPFNGVAVSPDFNNSLRYGGSVGPRLLSLTVSSTSLEFVFGTWVFGPINSSGSPHDVYGSVSTITQTITVANEYTVATVAGQAEALMEAGDLSMIAWGTSWTNTYNSSGDIVTTQNLAFDSTNAITCACKIGTEVKWGAAVNQLWSTAADISANGFFDSVSKALVDVCGQYCQRTYDCPTVTCESGAVDGFDPVEIDPPETPGESTGIYGSCTCI